MLTISGSGDMNNYTGKDDDYAPWFEYRAKIQRADISGVSSIGDYALYRASDMTSVNIGNTVTSIGKVAFGVCSSVKGFYIPASVTSIGQGAFGDCNSATAFEVDSASKNFTSVDGILFDKNMTTLINYPRGKTDEEYLIPNTVTTLGYYAFASSKLEKLTIPATVTKRTTGMTFRYCRDMTDLYLWHDSPDAAPMRSADFDGTEVNKITIHVLKGKKAAFEAHELFSTFKAVVEDQTAGLNELTAGKDFTVAGGRVDFGREVSFALFTTGGSLVASGKAASVALPGSGIYILRTTEGVATIVNR